MADSAPEPLTLHGAAVTLRSGALTAEKLLDQCLARIDQYEPAVKAWALVDRDGAREQARRLDAEYRAGRARGQLHGIPVGVKDIIDVAGLPTRHGVDWSDANPAQKDAPVVAQLREAGAVILGKTVTTPFAFLDPPPTRNPWNLDRTPGGSSSGSAAALACGMCLVALGTQTGGSLTRPASYCGVHSFKPTYGKLSVEGVLPLAPTLDHVGVLARSCAGLTAMAHALLGPETAAAREPEREDDDGPSLRVAAGPVPQATGPVQEWIARFVDKLTRGDGLAALDVPAAFAELPAANRAVYATEVARSHAARFDAHKEQYPPRLREMIEEGRAVPRADTEAALRLRDELAGFLKPGEWLLTPATADLPPSAETTGDSSMNGPWSFLGLPTVSVTVGWHDGLPYAVQLVGARGTDRKLLSVAGMVEQAAALVRPLPPAV